MDEKAEEMNEGEKIKCYTISSLQNSTVLYSIHRVYNPLQAIKRYNYLFNYPTYLLDKDWQQPLVCWASGN